MDELNRREKVARASRVAARAALPRCPACSKRLERDDQTAIWSDGDHEYPEALLRAYGALVAPSPTKVEVLLARVGTATVVVPTLDDELDRMAEELLARPSAEVTLPEKPRRKVRSWVYAAITVAGSVALLCWAPWVTGLFLPAWWLLSWGLSCDTTE